jgi:hypothetical protein
MARRRRTVNPVVERRRMLAAQAVGLALLALITLFFVYKGMSVA